MAVLAASVGCLSLVTGVVNLASVSRFAPVARHVPEFVRRVVSLTGSFTGFALLVSAWGLTRRLRIAWYMTLVLLPIAALQGVVQSSLLSVPLILLSLAAVPSVFLSRSSFDRRHPLSDTQTAAVVILSVVVLYGTVGSYVLRDGYSQIATPLDAFYYTVVTISTVGYGDGVPTTQLTRTFTLSLIVVGTAGFAVAVGAVLTPAIEKRLTTALGRMTTSELELLENHVIVLGYGDLTEPILRELDGRVEFVIVTEDSAGELGERGYNVLKADPSSEEAITTARIDTASAVVAATNNDAEDALSVLTARQLNPDVRLVSAATEQENVEKLRRAGADTVISPASIVGHLLVESALSGSDTEEIAESILEDKTRSEN
ncbi:MAG: NAD-binding protein [Halobacteria archaeon]|nr:NAD-binding protein [Halobacteria archaeon]